MSGNALHPDDFVLIEVEHKPEDAEFKSSIGAYKRRELLLLERYWETTGFQYYSDEICKVFSQANK